VPCYRERILPNAMPAPELPAGRRPRMASGGRDRAGPGWMAYPRHGSARRPNRAQGNLPDPGHDDARGATPAPTVRNLSNGLAGQGPKAAGFGIAARRPRARSRFRAGCDGTSAASLAAGSDLRRACQPLFYILGFTCLATKGEALGPPEGASIARSDQSRTARGGAQFWFLQRVGQDSDPGQGHAPTGQLGEAPAITFAHPSDRQPKADAGDVQQGCGERDQARTRNPRWCPASRPRGLARGKWRRTRPAP
jgi:hypothetical protein